MGKNEMLGRRLHVHSNLDIAGAITQHLGQGMENVNFKQFWFTLKLLFSSSR